MSLIKERSETLGRKIRIIDLGGTELYWNIFETDQLHIYVENILLINMSAASTKNLGIFSSVQADACNLTEFEDRSFDFAHSNSVIEHVGDWRSVEKFASEIRRVATCYYLQTPYFWFPIEPHFLCPFFHWLPERARVWLLMHLSLGNYPKIPDFGDAMKAVQGARLLDKRQIVNLFPDAKIRFERILGIPKSIIAVGGEVELAG